MLMHIHKVKHKPTYPSWPVLSPFRLYGTSLLIYYQNVVPRKSQLNERCLRNRHSKTMEMQWICQWYKVRYSKLVTWNRATTKSFPNWSLTKILCWWLDYNSTLTLPIRTFVPARCPDTQGTHSSQFHVGVALSPERTQQFWRKIHLTCSLAMAAELRAGKSYTAALRATRQQCCLLTFIPKRTHVRIAFALFTYHFTCVRKQQLNWTKRPRQYCDFANNIPPDRRVK